MPRESASVGAHSRCIASQTAVFTIWDSQGLDFRRESNTHQECGGETKVTSTFERNKQRDARVALEAAAMEAWGRFVAKYPQYDGEAFLRVVQEEMGNSFLLGGDEDFLYALETTRTNILPRRVPSPQEIKNDLIAEILSLLSAHSRRDKFMLKSEESRMKHMSVDVLEARLAELKYKIGAVSTPVSTLKAFVADARADTRKYPGFSTLERNIDAAHIKNLSTFELKKLIRVHSVQQVNDRLSGRN
jgi:hypothetical protein